MKKKRRSLKGMTLIEVLISITVVAVMATILVGAGSAINKYVKAANDVNKRVARQAPVAEASYRTAADANTSDIKVIVNNNVIVNGKLNNSDSSASMTSHSNEAGRNLNMKFFTELKTANEPESYKPVISVGDPVTPPPGGADPGADPGEGDPGADSGEADPGADPGEADPGADPGEADPGEGE